MTPHIPAPPIEPANVKSRAVSELPLPGEGMTMIPDSVLGPTALRPDVVHPLAPGAYYIPTGTGDGTAINALIAAQREHCPGVSIHLGAGTYDIDVPINLDDGNITLHLTADTVLQSTVEGTGIEDCVFRLHQPTVLDALDSTTLSATPTLGSRTVQVPKAVAVGSEIKIHSAAYSNDVLWYTVQRSAGESAPYTLTLDRKVVAPFASGDAVYVYAGNDRPKHIRVYGNGATVDANNHGGAVVSCLGASDVVFRDLRIINVNTDTNCEGFTFDTGSDHCSAERVVMYGGSLCASSNEAVRLIDCEVYDCATDISSGITLWDVIDAEVRGCRVENSDGFGLDIACNGTGWGCKNPLVIGCTFANNGNHGVSPTVVENMLLECVTCEGNTGHGVNLSGANITGLVQLNGLFANSNTMNGLYVGPHGATVRGSLECSKNANIDVQVDGQADLRVSSSGVLADGHQVIRSSSTNLNLDCNINVTGTAFPVYIEGGRARVRGYVSLEVGYAVICGGGYTSIDLDVATSGNGGTGVLLNNAAARARIDRLKVTMTGSITSYGLNAGTSGAVAEVQHLEIAGAASSRVGANLGAGATIRWLSAPRLSGATTAIDAAAGSYQSRGSGTLTGTTPVVVAFPDLRSLDTVRIIRTSVSGTPGHLTVAQTAGVGFTVVSTEASDVGTFTYSIE